jgi:hypothetical protein
MKTMLHPYPLRKRWRLTLLPHEPTIVIDGVTLTDAQWKEVLSGGSRTQRSRADA